MKSGFPKSRSASTRRRPPSNFTEPLKIKLSGKDDAPLSMAQLRDGLYEAVRRLLPYENNYRVKRVALYLTVIDETGTSVQIEHSGEWTIFPYQCAADDFDDRLP